MTIFCKPEAGLLIEANVIYMLNMQSQGSTTWSDLAGKTRVSTISWCSGPLSPGVHIHFSLIGSRLLISSSILLPNISSSVMHRSSLFIIPINTDLFYRTPYRNTTIICSTRAKHGRSVNHVRYWSLVSGIGWIWSCVMRFPEEIGRDGYDEYGQVCLGCWQSG